jgi:hypothetical protein
VASYQVVTSYRTVQVLSTTTVLDAEYVVCLTVPHGIGFAYAVPLDSWQSGAAGGLLDVIATQLEELAASNHVVGGVGVQEVDQQGLLYDAVDLTVEVDRSAQGLPPLDGVVTIPIQSFFAQDTGIGGFHIPGSVPPAQVVAEEYARLEALAAA